MSEVTNEKTVSPGRGKVFAALKLIALVAAAVLCILVVRPILTNPATFQNSIDYLDGKKQSAMSISLGTGSASFIVSALPNDMGTPIAAELAKLAEYILFVISAILLERYLLTALGFLATSVIMPLACLFGAFAVFSKGENRKKFRILFIRFVVLAIFLVQILPVACVCGQGIEAINRTSIEAAMDDAKKANEMIESIPEEAKKKNVFDKIEEFFSGLWDSAKEAYDWAKTVLSHFLSSTAVMIVTTIAIPIMILLFYLWVVRLLTHKDLIGSVISMVSGWFSREV
jgi:hypothetical protein